jgi:hypothetical protein
VPQDLQPGPSFVPLALKPRKPSFFLANLGKKLVSRDHHRSLYPVVRFDSGSLAFAIEQ